MQKSKIPFLTTITKALFAKQHAAAQESLWQTCMYGVDSKHPALKPPLDKIRDAIAKGAELDVQDKNGDTPLILLCRRGMGVEAKFLIDSGADVNIKNNAGETAFLAAAASGAGEAIRTLLEKRVDPLQKNAAGHDAAYLVVHAVTDFRDAWEKQNQKDALRMLLDRGLTLDDHLQMAVYHHKKHLLPAVPDVYKVRELADSADAGDAPNVSLLLGLPVHPDAPAKFKDNTPLCAGAYGGYIEMMDILLEKGADIELKSPDTHRTPLQTAVRAGQVEAYQYLLEKGAKFDGNMGLMELARETGNKNIMGAVYDTMIERGIMKTEVDTAKATMKKIKLKTPGGA
jgi:ankyrin repeat protein